MELKTLRALTKEMRRLGIKSLKTNDVELVLSDVAPSPKQRKRQDKESKIEGTDDGTSAPKWDSPDLSDDQKQENALFWSSEGIA